MFEVLLLAQLSCPHLANYVITDSGDCIDLSPVFQEGSSNLNISESYITSESDNIGEAVAFEDEFISARITRTFFSSFFVYITNNHPSRRIVPTYITYELLDSNSVPFYTGTYNTQNSANTVAGISPGNDSPTRVAYDGKTRLDHRTTLRDGYSVNILSITYDLGYDTAR